VYLALQEKINPRQPVTSALTAALKNVSPEQKSFIQARLNTLNAYTDAVNEALGGQTAAAKR
jgi:hypothetical protein